MRITQLVKLALVLLMGICLATTVWAQTDKTGENRNLFKTDQQGF